jgi:hypothetical protein
MGTRFSVTDDSGFSNSVCDDRRIHPLKIQFMTVMIGVSVFLTFLSLLSVGWTMRQLSSDRSASCAATLSSLDEIAQISAAGISFVITTIPTDISPQLAASFRQQIAQTKAENRRRRSVIASVQESRNRLQASAFCN